MGLISRLDYRGDIISSRGCEARLIVYKGF